MDSDTGSPVDIVSVALVLSGVERLRLAHEGATSPHLRQVLLMASADLLDRTLPFPEFKTQYQQANPESQVAFLVEHRKQLAPIPPGLWKSLRVQPSALGSEHYSGFRALDRALRLAHDSRALTWEKLCSWLQPAWVSYPELKEDASGWCTLGSQ